MIWKQVVEGEARIDHVVPERAREPRRRACIEESRRDVGAHRAVVQAERPRAAVRRGPGLEEGLCRRLRNGVGPLLALENFLGVLHPMEVATVDVGVVAGESGRLIWRCCDIEQVDTELNMRLGVEVGRVASLLRPYPLLVVAQQHHVCAILGELTDQVGDDLVHGSIDVLLSSVPGLGRRLHDEAREDLLTKRVLWGAGREATARADLDAILPMHPRGCLSETRAMVKVGFRVDDLPSAALAVRIHAAHCLAIRILRPARHVVIAIVARAGTQFPGTFCLGAIAWLGLEPLIGNAPVVLPVLVHQLALVAKALARPIQNWPILELPVRDLVLRVVGREGPDEVLCEEVLLWIVPILAVVGVVGHVPIWHGADAWVHRQEGQLVLEQQQSMEGHEVRPEVTLIAPWVHRGASMQHQHVVVVVEVGPVAPLPLGCVQRLQRPEGLHHLGFGRCVEGTPFPAHARLLVIDGPLFARWRAFSA
mmetsp:Transcript_41497/g.109435  ORF Transcript_41497/g.109435 Transcript_41497/m.109435 type:complete len:480 (+) Transcript_41497:333-1772(+)